jgi:hypothetical protein
LTFAFPFLKRDTKSFIRITGGKIFLELQRKKMQMGSIPMRIIVPIKQVAETRAVKMDEGTGTMIGEGVEAIINPLDA